MPDSASDIDQFIDGLMAARMAKIDLDVGDADASSLLSEKDIRALKSTAPPSDSDGPHFESPRLDAAFEVFRKTGSLTTAIEGLSFRTRGRARLRQLTRRTNLYLILIVLTAIASLAFFWFQLRPGLELIHADIVATSGVDLPEHHDGLMVLACLVVLLLILIGLLWQLFGKKTWFTRFSGADTYLDLGQQALLWSTTRRLVENGQPISASKMTAGSLLGMDCQRQLLPGGAACESLQQIASAQDLMETLASQKIESISTTLPTVAVVIVGGGCGLICCLATFYPTVRLLDELSRVSI